MEIIVEGSEYKLNNLKDRTISQDIKFVTKDLDGTSSEEVLRVLINRHKNLNHKVKQEENSTIIEKLKECLTLLNERVNKKKEKFKSE